MKRAVDSSPATKARAGGAAASVAELRHVGAARRGLARRTVGAGQRGAQWSDGAGVTQTRIGSGGDAATGGGVGGASGAAELDSQRIGHAFGTTTALGTFAQSHAPEPFLLLLERPG